MARGLGTDWCNPDCPSYENGYCTEFKKKLVLDGRYSLRCPMCFKTYGGCQPEEMIEYYENYEEPVEDSYWNIIPERDDYGPRE